MFIDKKKVGDRIKYIRLSNNLTMKNFGIEIGKKLNTKRVQEGIISRWEDGTSLPNADRINAIAEIGNVSVKYLLEGEPTLADLPQEDLQKYIAELIEKSNYRKSFAQQNLHTDILKGITYDNLVTLLSTYAEQDEDTILLLNAMFNLLSKYEDNDMLINCITEFINQISSSDSDSPEDKKILLDRIYQKLLDQYIK